MLAVFRRSSNQLISCFSTLLTPLASLSSLHFSATSSLYPIFCRISPKKKVQKRKRNFNRYLINMKVVVAEPLLGLDCEQGDAHRWKSKTFNCFPDENTKFLPSSLLLSLSFDRTNWKSNYWMTTFALNSRRQMWIKKFRWCRHVSWIS